MSKKIRVIAQGTFDVLHPGHLYYLSRAKALGSELVVIVSRDANVKRFKKRAPLFSEKERVQLVRALKPVDEAVLGGNGNLLDVVVKLRPQVIALGSDPVIAPVELKKRLLARGLECKIVSIGAKNKKKYSSSAIKKKMSAMKEANS